MTAHYYAEITDSYDEFRNVWYFFNLKANMINWNNDLADNDDWLFVCDGSDDSYLEFDGEDDYVKVPNSEEISEIDDGDWTASFWLNTTQQGADKWSQVVIIDHRQWGDDNYWILHVYLNGDNRVVAYEGGWDGSINREVTTSTTVNDSEWHYITVTRNASGLKIYCDGNKEDENNNENTDPPETDKSTVFGARRDNTGSIRGDSFYNGLLRDIQLYSRTLTSTEISELYNGDEISDEGLVLDMPLNEGSGKYAYDNSGNGNSGIIDGATWKNTENFYEGKIKRLTRNKDKGFIKYFVSDYKLEELEGKNVYLELSTSGIDVTKSLGNSVDKCNVNIPFHESFPCSIGDDLYVFLSNKDYPYFYGRVEDYEEEGGIIRYNSMGLGYNLMKTHKTKVFRNWKPEKIVEGLVGSNSSMTVSYTATDERIDKFPVDDYIWDAINKLADGYRYQIRIRGDTLYFEPKGHIKSSLEIDKDIMLFTKTNYDSEKVVNDLYLKVAPVTYETIYEHTLLAGDNKEVFVVDHPISGNVRIRVNNTEKSASSYTVDKEAGEVTMDTALQTDDVIEIYYQYEAPTTIHIEDSSSISKYGRRSLNRRADWLRDVDTGREFAYEYILDNKDADWDANGIIPFKYFINHNIGVGRKYKVKNQRYGLNTNLVCKRLRISSRGNKGGKVEAEFGTIRRDVIDWHRDVKQRMKELEKQIEADIIVSEYKRWLAPLDIDLDSAFDIPITEVMSDVLNPIKTPLVIKIDDATITYDIRFKIGVELLGANKSG